MIEANLLLHHQFRSFRSPFIICSVFLKFPLCFNEKFPFASACIFVALPCPLFRSVPKIILHRTCHKLHLRPADCIKIFQFFLVFPPFYAVHFFLNCFIFMVRLIIMLAHCIISIEAIVAMCARILYPNCEYFSWKEI